MFLYRICKHLQRRKVPYALVGGHAVALHGAVRGTLDIDIVVEVTAVGFEKTERALIELGLQPRLPVSASEVYSFRREYIENRNLTAWSFVNSSKPSECVDVIITHDVRKMNVVTMKLEGFSIRVASIEELIKMKEGTGREQDALDVVALKKLLKMGGDR